MKTLIFEKQRLQRKLNILPWNDKSWPLCSLTNDDNTDAYTLDKLPFPCHDPDPLVSKKRGKTPNSDKQKLPVAKRIKVDKQHKLTEPNEQSEHGSKQTKIVLSSLTLKENVKKKNVVNEESAKAHDDKNDETTPAKLKTKSKSKSEGSKAKRKLEDGDNKKASQQAFESPQTAVTVSDPYKKLATPQTAVSVSDTNKKPTHEEFITNFMKEDHYLKLQCMFTSFGGYDISEEDLWDLVFQYYGKRKSSKATFMQMVLKNANQMVSKKIANDIFFLREEYSDTTNFAKTVKANEKDHAAMKTFIRLFAALMPAAR